MKQGLLALIFACFALLPLFGQEPVKVYTIDDVPNVFERDSTQFVSDPEGYFTPEERVAINRRLDDLGAHNGVQAVLVVVPAIPEDDELAFTTALFRKWGIGNARDDSGLLILFVTDPSYRVIRFEVGYGLEGVITDYRSDRYIRKYLIPAVTEGRAAEGFTAMLGDMDTLLQKEHDALLAPAEGDALSDGGTFWTLILLWLAASAVYAALVILFLKWRVARKGSSSVDSVKEVIALTSGQGYALLLIFTVIFMPSVFVLLPFVSAMEKKNRTRTADCPKCGTKGSVHQVHYPANLPYLSKGEETESSVGSKEYTILECNRCDYREKVAAIRPDSSYADCPSCGYRTYHKVRTIRATSHYVTDHYLCENCGHSERKRRRVSSDSAPLVTGGAVGGFIGGGGFGGGGFGGGSFGGGTSGGGGASVHF